MKFFILFLFFFINSNNLFSQNNHLPDWLFKTEYYNSSEYAVGISDPLSDTTIAMKQAINRALINYSLFHKSRYGSLTSVQLANAQNDNYTPNRIETILFSSLFFGKFALKDSFEVADKAFSIYGECVVLLRKTEYCYAHPDTITFAFSRQIAFYKGLEEIPLMEDEISIKMVKVKADSSVQYSLYTINRDNLSKYSISSKFESEDYREEYDVKNKFCQYSKVDISEKLKCSEPLTYGIWAAYIYALSDKISVYSALSRNNTNRLVSISQGNFQKMEELPLNALYNEAFYNTKKIELKQLNLKLKKIDLSGNKLALKTSLEKDMKDLNYSILPLNKKEKKVVKKMDNENVSELNFKNIPQAYFAQKYFYNSEHYISGEAVSRSANLCSGILHGILKARLVIETQLNSQITALSSISVSDDLSVVKNSKSVTGTIANAIFPYFFFIKKIKANAYEIDTKLFYKIN